MAEKIFRYTLLALLYGGISALICFMIYSGYGGIASGSRIGIFFGIISITVGLIVPVNILIRNDRIKNLIHIGLGSIIVIWIFSVLAMACVGFMILPFTGADLSIDLGIIVLKSSFVRFIYIALSVIFIFYVFKFIINFIRNKVKRQ